MFSFSDSAGKDAKAHADALSRQRSAELAVLQVPCAVGNNFTPARVWGVGN